MGRFDSSFMSDFTCLINSVILSVLLAANFQIERCNKGVWVGLAPGQTHFLGLTIGFQLNSGDLASQCFIFLFLRSGVRICVVEDR